ncbi:MAG: LysR family transcriptional regulator [Phycisphaerae bacterium]
MYLSQLEYFIAVAETGSISKGAAQCLIAQPSMTQQMQKLEARIGVQLFDRVGRGVVLTDAGRALLPRAKKLLADAHDLTHGVREDTEKGNVPFAIGAIPTMAPYLLPSVLKKLPQEFPACEMSVREDFTDRVIDGVISNELDFAIVSTPIESDLIELDVLGKEDFLVVAPADMELAERAKASLATLRDEPAIVLHEMHCLGTQVQGFCIAQKLVRRIVCRSTQIPTILEMVAMGIGYSFVPEMVAQADRSSLRRYFRVARGTPARDIAIAWRRGRSRSTVARRAADLLRSNLASGQHRYAP